MHVKSHFFALFITIFLVLTQAAIATTISEESFTQIIRNEAYCVKDYDHDKIYLNSENLYPTNEGLLLDLNGGEYILIPALQSDNTGCWVPITHKNIEILNKCPLCGRRYFVRCKNPECPSNKQ